ncbi:hypothetical protein AAA799E16_01641 [Marine Group I thaumarchaeote SCGC AAA799-E16]|uniref:Uncharacterized protein n=2 Tax=Marine Group I TaxID=905826 RepID=A0A087RXY1_9ARCH|nr:hypothetical protein AAA799E16_01641 [Marine Group I thaumarchaeote SCGC AAA799-E16]KFM18335.1 hypothetical protein SCCGRSA3_01259 [Marine Group I thaumarchaeote SCGC RSA3]
MSNTKYLKVNIVLRKDQHVFCKEHCINISKLSRNSIDNLKEKLKDSKFIKTKESPVNNDKEFLN